MAQVLVVEDQEPNARLIRLLLASLGHDVVEARTGTMALEMLQTLVPDLILMDVQLPDIDGLEVTQRVRRDRRFVTTPIIALTAFAMPEDRARCLAAGCTDYVTKPIDTRTFPALLARYLPSWSACSPC